MASLLQKVVGGGGGVKAEKPIKLYSHAGVSAAHSTLPLALSEATDEHSHRGPTHGR